VISGEIHEIIEQIGLETGCTVIDLYALTEQHREWFADGIHLNRKGADAVAEAVFRVINRQK
jgi:lysophospholipase L1-like esterase